MAAKQRLPQRLKSLSVSKMEFYLPPKNSSSTKSATQGRIRSENVLFKTVLIKKTQSKLSFAEKKSEIKTYTGQTNTVKTVNGQNANGNENLSNPPSIKPMNGDHGKESKEKKRLINRIRKKSMTVVTGNRKQILKLS